jgi:hypothetical protein
LDHTLAQPLPILNIPPARPSRRMPQDRLVGARTVGWTRLADHPAQCSFGDEGAQMVEMQGGLLEPVAETAHCYKVTGIAGVRLEFLS